jgi:FAD/FMN-containing dehydrogenase
MRTASDWASCISIVREDMPSFYPRLPDFQAIRRKMDPAGRFLNDHLRNLFA